MRFNGNGYYGGGSAASNASCDSTIAPSYNSLNISSGAEVSLWIWQQYLDTGNTAVPASRLPADEGGRAVPAVLRHHRLDGLLHTTANAHETQWDVTDPVTDILAMQALFPAVASAAQKLDTDASFASQLIADEAKIPPLPRTDAATHSQVLTAVADAGGQDVIALSTQPTAPKQQRREPRPGSDLPVQRDRRQLRFADRAGRPHLQRAAVPEQRRLGLRRPLRRPAGPGRSGAVRPDRQRREVPALPGRHGQPVRHASAASRTTRRPASSRPP